MGRSIDNNELEKMRASANKAVNYFSAMAVAACWVPIPVADTAILCSIQSGMLYFINRKYKIKMKKDVAMSIAQVSLGIGGATLAGKTLFSTLAKILPGGVVVSGAITAGPAGSLTMLLGKAYMSVCEAIKKGEISSNDKEAIVDMMKTRQEIVAEKDADELIKYAGEKNKEAKKGDEEKKKRAREWQRKLKNDANTDEARKNKEKFKRKKNKE